MGLPLAGHERPNPVHFVSLSADGPTEISYRKIASGTRKEIIAGCRCFFTAFCRTSDEPSDVATSCPMRIAHTVTEWHCALLGALSANGQSHQKGAGR